MTATVNPPSRQLPHAASIPPSCVHAVYRSVNDWQRRTGRKVVRLDIGEPYFTPPRAAVEALAAAVRDGRTSYTPAEGLPELRARLAEKLVRHNKHRTSPELVYVTPGASQGICAVLQSVTDPGDEILMPAFHWPIHLQQALLCRLRPRFYPLTDDLRPDLEALRGMATEKTRVLLVNTPSNPTGVVYDPHTMMSLLELAHEHDWAVLSDEAYEDFVYEGEHLSMAALERDLPGRQRRVFTVFSYSKSFAMTGYRLGYVAAPNAVRGTILQAVEEASILSSPTPVQYAGLAALEAMDEVDGNRKGVLSARDGLAPLVDLGLLKQLPAGGWFALLDCAGVGVRAEEFAAGLLEREAIAVAPARGFALRPVTATDGTVESMGADPATETLLRIAFCGRPDQVCEAAGKIADLARTG